MDETTSKILALYDNIRCTGVANLSTSKTKLLTPYHVIMYGILLITCSASIFQMSVGGNGLREKQLKISKFDLNSY